MLYNSISVDMCAYFLKWCCQVCLNIPEKSEKKLIWVVTSEYEDYKTRAGRGGNANFGGVYASVVIFKKN